MLALRVIDLMSMYCTSKAALDMLTKCMALKFGKHSIRVNAMNLGMVKTTGFNALESQPDGEELLKQFLGPQMAKVHYGGDFLPMDEVVNSILFTASDLAPTLTGSCIVHDGGYSLA